MKIFIIALLFLTGYSTFAIEGVSIGNFYQVDKEGHVFRGRGPGKLIKELADFGITDILIFKNEVKSEVTTEILEAEKLNMAPHHIPFRWKDLESSEITCGQVIDALTLIKRIKNKGQKIYFHCTAGEDRTGLLAALYRMLEERVPMQEMFKKEMCDRGYSDGNPHKPYSVHIAIQQELTPLFIALAKEIENGTLTQGALSKRVCRSLKVVPTTLKCRK